MRTLRELLDDMIIDIRDHRLAESPRERDTLFPVWVRPMIRRADTGIPPPPATAPPEVFRQRARVRRLSR